MGDHEGEGVIYDDLVEREGLLYKKFTDIPFTGKTTGQTQETYKDGVIDGSCEYYFASGQLGEKGTYANGKKEGPWVSYHDNGQLAEKGDYEDGEEEGPWVKYWDNGQLRRKGDYKNGRAEGVWVSYHYNGTLSEKGVDELRDSSRNVSALSVITSVTYSSGW